MTVAASWMSLAEYLAYDDDSDICYELENGELVVMPLESDINRRIATFLLVYFAQLGIAPRCLTMKTEMVVSGARATVRLPDLMVLSEELAEVLAGASRSLVTLEMPPPQLVVEVVSPGKPNIDRDYRYKKSQYEAREIAEYWIVDPLVQRVTVLTLVDGLYEMAIFEGQMVLVSGLLQALAPEQSLTAAQLLAAQS
jgi:Uma2 family endonuclease